MRPQPTRSTTPSDSFRLALALLLVLLLLVAPRLARAGLFSTGHFLRSKSMKLPQADELVSVGITFSMAPARSMAQQGINRVVEKDPDLAPYVALASDIDPSLYEGLDLALAKEKLKAQLPGLTPAQLKEVEDLTEEDMDQFLELTEIVQAAGHNFTLEPFARVNLPWLGIGIHTPVAGFYDYDGLHYHLGNILLDTSTGWSWGTGMGTGVTIGMELYLPTASEEAFPAVLQDPLSFSRYQHGTMTMAPYVVFGADIHFLELQAYGQLFLSPSVTDDPDVSGSAHVRWGTTAAISITRFVCLKAELGGLGEIIGASTQHGVFFTGGIYLDIFGVRPGAAIQMPLTGDDDSALAEKAGVEGIGDPVAWRVLANLTITL